MASASHPSVLGTNCSHSLHHHFHNHREEEERVTEDSAAMTATNHMKESPSSRPTFSHTSPPPPSNAASCMVCWGDDADDEGELPTRFCPQCTCTAHGTCLRRFFLKSPDQRVRCLVCRRELVLGAVATSSRNYRSSILQSGMFARFARAELWRAILHHGFLFWLPLAVLMRYVVQPLAQANALTWGSIVTATFLCSLSRLLLSAAADTLVSSVLLCTPTTQRPAVRTAPLTLAVRRMVRAVQDWWSRSQELRLSLLWLALPCGLHLADIVCFGRPGFSFAQLQYRDVLWTSWTLHLFVWLQEALGIVFCIILFASVVSLLQRQAGMQLFNSFRGAILFVIVELVAGTVLGSSLFCTPTMFVAVVSAQALVRGPVDELVRFHKLRRVLEIVHLRPV